MFFARLIAGLFIGAAMLGIAGCGDITDDLFPDSSDRRPDVEAGSSGTQVGQLTPDFLLTDTLDIDRGLYNELSNSSGVVLYFTMWCSTCDEHMSHMREKVIPNFPNVKFFLIDYTSGSISNARASQINSTFADIKTLVDMNKLVENLYQASMGTTIVIDSAGNIVRMNELYKNGDKLIKTLQALP